MKPIDGDALFCKFWSLADPYVKQKKVFPSQVWNQAATMVREAPNLHTTNYDSFVSPISVNTRKVLCRKASGVFVFRGISPIWAGFG